MKFLLIKGFHLLTALIIILVLLVYFHQCNQIDKKAVNAAKEEKADIIESAYLQFCRNNKDANCGDLQNFVTEDYSVAEVILSESENQNRVQQITEIASLGTNIDIPFQDTAELLDKIYEETLLEDILEPQKKPVKKAIAKKNSSAKNPLVVIVIDDMGISQKHTAEIASLRYPLTVAFLTYGKKIAEQVEQSRAAGQEIILHTPMEPKKSADTAPDTLTTKMKAKEIKQNLSKMIAKVPHIVGANNHMGSKLTEDYDRMLAVMEVLKEKNLFFLDSKTSGKSRAEEAAQKIGVPYAHRQVFLDNTNDKTYILGQLKKLETLAKKNGYAIAIGHPKSGTYEALKEWLPKTKEKGLDLAHLSKVITILNF